MLDHSIVLSVVPFRVMPPPSAVESVGLATEPISMFLSSTVRVVLLIVVVVPLTVKCPAKVTVSLDVAPVEEIPKIPAVCLRDVPSPSSLRNFVPPVSPV